MADAEELGFPTSSGLKEILTNSTDPVFDIKSFQDANGIQLPSIYPALSLLDLLGVRRSDFYQSVLDDIQKNMNARVLELGQSKDKKDIKKVEELLSKCFKHSKTPTIQPIVLFCLKALPKVPDSYLKQIREDPDLYEELDIEVKQQIWISKEALFLEELKPLFQQYVADKDHKLLEIDISGTFSGQINSGASASATFPSFFAEHSKTRRQNTVIQTLVKMLGRSVVLYDKVLNQIRLHFLESKNVHYCSLRAELLMALHDADVTELIKLDPCHRFAWCLDACIRERHLDPKHAKELQSMLDGIRRNQEILGDLAVIAGDPHASYFLQLLVLKVINQCIVHETLPRDNASLTLVFRLLKLGTKAWTMFDSCEYKEDPLESIIGTRLVPSLMVLMCDDQLRNLSIKISDEAMVLCDEDKSLLISDAKLRETLDTVVTFAHTDAMACQIVLQYLLDTVQRKDRAAVLRLLPLLTDTARSLTFSMPFLHSFVHCLSVNLDDAFQDDDFVNCVFEQFLLKSSEEHVKLFALKLLYTVPVVSAEHLVEKLKPNSESSFQYLTFHTTVENSVTKRQQLSDSFSEAV